MIRPTVLLAALCLVASASAQVLPNSPYLTLEQRGAFLLAQPGLQKKIDLPDPLVQSIMARFAAYAAKQDQLFSTPKPDDAAVRKLDVATATDLLSTLPPTSRKKLFQLTLSRAGASALVAPDVAKKLKLTPAQMAKIQATIDSSTEPEHRLEAIIAERTAKAADDAERKSIQTMYSAERKRLAIQREKAQAKAFAVLTPAQKKAFAALGK